MDKNRNMGEWDNRCPLWEQDLPFENTEFSQIDAPKTHAGGSIIHFD
jgi:hypothetical protein